MLIIYNNFFDNAEKIREDAIKAFEKQHDCILNDSIPQYPGVRIKVENEVELKIKQFIENRLKKNVSNMVSFYHITSRIHKLGCIHRDRCFSFAGLVYLNQNPPKHSGTILCSKKYGDKQSYKNFSEIFNEASITKDISIIKNFSSFKEEYNNKNFIINCEIENKFNRLIIYDANKYHAPYYYFGNNLYNSRLALVFFFVLE